MRLADRRSERNGGTLTTSVREDLVAGDLRNPSTIYREAVEAPQRVLIDWDFSAHGIWKILSPAEQTSTKSFDALRKGLKKMLFPEGFRLRDHVSPVRTPDSLLGGRGFEPPVPLPNESVSPAEREVPQSQRDSATCRFRDD